MSSSSSSTSTHATLTPLQQSAARICRADCSPAAVEAALPSAFEVLRAAGATGDATLIAKAIEKHQAELMKLAAHFDAVIFDNPAAALSQARLLAPMWHQVADNEKSAAELVKQSFKALFRGEASLPLSPADAEQFFGFVRDVLVASQAGLLTAAGVLSPSGQDAVRALGPFLAATTGSMNTHDAKSAHSSAQLQVVCSSAVARSRFFNSSAFPAGVSARAGGGPLRLVSWLENLYCFRMQLAGKTFMVIDALCSQAIRDHLAAQGVLAFADVPLAKPASGGYSGHLVGQTRMKTPSGSVSLNLLPSNAMLAMSADLGSRIAAKTALRVAGLYREAVLAAVPEAVRDMLAADFPVEAFVPAAESRFNEDKLIRALNAVLKPHRVRLLDRTVLAEIWKAPEPNRLRQARHLVRVPTVGSNPQNCGGAYLAYAGKQGPYRFPAAPVFQRKTSTRGVRSFHAAGAIFAEALRAEIDKRADAQSLEDKYQLGNKWLPRRVQRNLQRGHTQEAARSYVRLIRRLAGGIRLTEDERLQLEGSRMSHIQHYILLGPQAETERLRELAGEGVALLKSADADARDMFVDAVTTLLQETHA